MFGILYTLGVLVGGAISGTKCAIENIQAKERGYQRKEQGENLANVYIDRKGATRDLATNKFASIERDVLTGDMWVRHGAPSVRVRNVSKEWRDKNYSNHIIYPEDGRTVVIDIEIPANSICLKESLLFHGMQWKKEYLCYGQWYKDLNDGSLYVIRHFPTTLLYQVMNLTKEQEMDCLKNYYDVEFYMDVHSRKFVRLTDEYIEEEGKKDPKDRVPKEVVERIKTGWNNRIENDRASEFLDEDSLGIYWNDYYFNNFNVEVSKRTEKEINSMGKARPQRYAR